MSFEELNTVIVEIEKCVNWRPLTYLPEEREDTVIIPNHFIYGRDIDRNESVQNGKLIVKLYLNILQNDLFKNLTSITGDTFLFES